MSVSNLQHISSSLVYCDTDTELLCVMEFTYILEQETPSEWLLEAHFLEVDFALVPNELAHLKTALHVFLVS